MARLYLVAWLVICTVQPAVAGAWLREQGKGFLAYSNLTTTTMNTTFSAYLDYGLRDNLTLGATFDLDAPIGGYYTGKGLVFMRKSLGWGGEKANWAYEIGLGARYTGLKFLPIAKTTLSYGRGIKWGERHGWLAVDTGVEWEFENASHVAKIDTTLGLELGKRSKGMLQVFSSFGQGWHNITISPSYVFQSKKNKSNYVVGLEASSLYPNVVALKIGVWQSF